MVARSTLLFIFQSFIKVYMFSGTRIPYRAKNRFRGKYISELHNNMLLNIISNMCLSSIEKTRSARSTFIKKLIFNRLSGTRFLAY